MDGRGSHGANGGHWRSRAGFILASLGAAAGLGNIWRFAYVAGANGGGVFFFIYIVSILAIGLPIPIAELVIGRAAGGYAEGAGEREGRPKPLDALSVTVAFLILSYYGTALSRAGPQISRRRRDRRAVGQGRRGLWRVLLRLRRQRLGAARLAGGDS